MNSKIICILENQANNNSLPRPMLMKRFCFLFVIFLSATIITYSQENALNDSAKLSETNNSENINAKTLSQSITAKFFSELNMNDEQKQK